MRLFYALPASIAALLLAACAAFSSADSPDDDGSAPTSDDGASPESGGGTSEGGPSNDDDSAAPTSEGGAPASGYGNTTRGLVGCGAEPSCITQSPDLMDGGLRCCQEGNIASCKAAKEGVSMCTERTTIACDGPEDCDGRSCRPEVQPTPQRTFFRCVTKNFELAACHTNKDCGGAFPRCRALACGPVTLGVCVASDTPFLDGSECAWVP